MEDFDKSVTAYKAIVEAAAAKADDATRLRMQEHFKQACLLEYGRGSPYVPCAVYGLTSVEGGWCGGPSVLEPHCTLAPPPER